MPYSNNLDNYKINSMTYDNISKKPDIELASFFKSIDKNIKLLNCMRALDTFDYNQFIYLIWGVNLNNNAKFITKNGDVTFELTADDINSLTVSTLTIAILLLQKLDIDKIIINNVDNVEKYPNIALLYLFLSKTNSQIEVCIPGNAASNMFNQQEHGENLFNIYHQTVRIPCCFYTTKPQNDTMNIMDLLQVSNLVDCYLPGSDNKTAATQEQIKSYMSDILRDYISKDCLPLDILQHAVFPYTHTVKISTAFYEANPQLFHPIIAKMFIEMKSDNLPAETFQKIKSFVPFLNSPTLIAIQNHASQYNKANVVQVSSEELIARNESNIDSSAASRVVCERIQNQSETRSRFPNR